MADLTKRLDSLDLLHPYGKPRFVALANRLKEAYVTGECRTLFLPFETLRLPQRQDYPKRSTNSTKVGAWGSTHQYGLAVDFVPFMDGAWSWDDNHAWNKLDLIAAECGLVRPIRWDRPHIEHPKASYLVNEFKVLLSSPLKVADGSTPLAGWVQGDAEA